MASKRSKSVVELRSQGAVLAAIRRHYDASSWAVLANVANATGARGDRFADAIAMSLWPSRGLVVHGFEIKTDRRDLLREIKNPYKADGVAKYCDYWWIVVGSEAVAKAEDLPETWGLLAPRKVRDDEYDLKTLKQAKKLKPRKLDRAFVASVLRRASTHFDADAIRKDTEREIRTAAYCEIEKLLQERHQNDREELVRQAAAERERANEVTAQLRIATESQFSAVLVGRAVKLLSRLTGWSGAESTTVHAITVLEQQAAVFANLQETLREIRDIVQIVTGPKESA